jgi:hypothetical protein
MPRKKRIRSICAPRKYDWKKKGFLPDKEHYEIEIVQEETNCENPIKTEVNELTDASQQTEDYIINDHDYCVNTYTHWDSDFEYNTLNNVVLGHAVNDDTTTRNSAFINICEVEEVEVQTTQFAALANDIRKNISQDFVVYCTETKISVLQMYSNEYASAIKLSVEISSNFTCQVFVHRKPVPKAHEIWENLPVCFDRMEYVEKLCQRIKCYEVCCGNPDEEFTSLVPIGAELSSNNSPGILAVREGDFHAVHGGMSYSSTICSVDCFLLTKGNRCKKCSDYRGALRKRKNRLQEKQDSKRKYNHTNFKHRDMTRENLLQKVDEQKEEIKCLQSELCKMKRDFDRLVKSHS